MKRLLTAALLAALALIGSVQETHAWSKCNFGVGLNWRWEGGGNSFMWGLARGANVPDPMMGGYAGGDGGGDHGGYGMSAPAMPSAPEKVTQPTPLRPASYRSEQQPAAAYQQAAPEAPVYAAPSYWYDR